MSTAKPEFQIGDVVRLRSGGPEMTVVGTATGEVYCAWFSKEGESKRDKWAAGALEKVGDQA